MSRTRLLTSVAAAMVGIGLASGASAAVQVMPATSAGMGLYVAETGNVSITFDGRDGGYAKELYYVGEEGDQFLFDDSSVVGTTIDLGVFEAGRELVFRLATRVNTAFAQDLFTGDPTRNPLDMANARAAEMASAITTVSFEDMVGGGDRDFNDFGFTLENVTTDPDAAVPIPGAAALMVTGLGAAAVARRRRKA